MMVGPEACLSVSLLCEVSVLHNPLSSRLPSVSSVLVVRAKKFLSAVLALSAKVSF